MVIGPRNFNFYRGLIFSAFESQTDHLAELGNLQRENKLLLGKFGYAHEAATMARRAQLMGEEKLRRQNELPQESRQAADVAVKGHSQLLIKLYELQTWTDLLTAMIQFE
jgi:hypothetical protein